MIKDKAERNNTIDNIKSQGGHIIHDSGGRLLIIEAGRVEDKIRNNLSQNTRMMNVDEINKNLLENLDNSESIFLDALNLKNTVIYQAAKRNRKPPGEEPEEKEMLLGSCMGDEE